MYAYKYACVALANENASVGGWFPKKQRVASSFLGTQKDTRAVRALHSHARASRNLSTAQTHARPNACVRNTLTSTRRVTRAATRVVVATWWREGNHRDGMKMRGVNAVRAPRRRLRRWRGGVICSGCVRARERRDGAREAMRELANACGM